MSTEQIPKLLPLLTRYRKECNLQGIRKPPVLEANPREWSALQHEVSVGMTEYGGYFADREEVTVFGVTIKYSDTSE